MTDAREHTDYYTSSTFTRRLARRRGRERLLKGLGIAAIVAAVGMLAVLFVSIVDQGSTAFQQTRIGLPVQINMDLEGLDTQEAEAAIRAADYRGMIRDGLTELLGEVSGRTARRELSRLMSSGAGFRLQEAVLEDPSLAGTRQVVWLPASSDVDIMAKGLVPRDVPEGSRRLTDRQLAWVDEIDRQGALEVGFNTDFFLRNDSREPEEAGIFAAVVGSALMLLVTLVLTVPVGVAAAVYLEEFAPKHWWTELIDVNIRNLAAVPSIVFGLLGLAVFIQLFGVPRSTPVAGGMVLALMTLPTVIIAARAAVQAVPPSLRYAALELGASRMQSTGLVVVPNALPGILTGTIIGMAEALGETAPLLMIGMVAFIPDTPGGFTDPAAPLPVQIFTWSTSPERGFVEKTAAAIIVLLVFMVAMNALAIYLRNRLQKKW